jgi:hypothetical protein
MHAFKKEYRKKLALERLSQFEKYHRGIKCL